MAKIIFALTLICWATVSYAQTEYHFFVQFHDKMLSYTELEQPELFLSQRSLQRRTNQGIKVDSVDLPVTKAYIDNIIADGVRLKYVSKWLNGAVITVADKRDAYRLKIKFFVDSVIFLGSSKKVTRSTDPIGLDALKKALDSEPKPKPQIKEGYNQSYEQINMVNGIPLHKQGYKGRGVWIAVFDAGFKRVHDLSAFQPMIDEDRLKATYDLVDGGDAVFEDNGHGMNVLGIMAADATNKMIGTAPDATYLLFRTETKREENLLEELNWVRAAEIADSLGADIINSSLGYNTFDEGRMNHTHEELDGKTAMITRGAAHAAARGILVVNASGNDGNKKWKKINFPADADGILTVGAVNSELEPPAFSSYGPTADFRIKPEISALGYQTTITTTYGIAYGNGTSFSCPIIAGLMACLWQVDRSLQPHELIDIIRRTGHLGGEPDHVIGYGVPDFNLALTMVGKNKGFNYAKPGLLYALSDTIRNDAYLDFFAPNSTSVSFELREKRRFLFFCRYKTMHKQVYSVPADGFTKVKLDHPSNPLKRNVQIRISQLDSTTNRKGNLLYIGKSVLVK